MSEENKEQEPKAEEPTSQDAKKNEEPKKPAGFASFVQRALATYVDYTLVFAIYFVLELILIKPIFKVTIFSCCLDLFSRPPGFLKTIAGLFVVLFILSILHLLVSAYLEASAKFGGLGKKILGIYVLDEHLRPLKFSKSLIRSLSKLLSASVLGLGFILYFFNKKKQSLHDIVAHTIVVRRAEVDANRLTVIFSFCFLSTIAFGVGLRFLKPVEAKSNGLPKRVVDVIPPAKGFVQLADDLINLKDSLAVYDPLREKIEVFASSRKLEKEQIDSLINQHSETIPDFINFKASIKLDPEGIKCSTEAIVETNYNIMGDEIALVGNKPEINELHCELLNDSHFYAKFFRKKSETEGEKNWDIQLSSKLNIRRESAKIKYDSESTNSSVAIWHHDQNNNFVEVGFFSNKVSDLELFNIRKSKSLVESKPNVIVTFELQPNADNLNVATVIKYGVSYIRSEEIHFPGKSERVDFFYVPSVTENLQLAKLSGKLAEGERITGYLNHQAKKVIAEVDFDVEWNIVFNLSLLDLEQEPVDLSHLPVEQSSNAEIGQSSCVIKADQSELVGVDSIALYYPEEGDVAVGVFSEALTASEKEEFRKKKSIWLNVNGKIASFVIFFDLKREAQSFSRELLLEYNVTFIKDSYGRLYFPGNSGRAQFNFKEIDFTPLDVNSLRGSFNDGAEISFRLKKKKESKLSGIHFSWDCNLSTKLYTITNR